MAETHIQHRENRGENRPEARRAEAKDVRRLTFPVDVYETEDDVLLVGDLPGVKREDLDIHVERHELTIEGRRAHPDGAWYYRRSFTLPDTVDADRITAEIRHGVLRLTLPKSEAVKPRRIPVRGEE